CGRQCSGRVRCGSLGNYGRKSSLAVKRRSRRSNGSDFLGGDVSRQAGWYRTLKLLLQVRGRPALAACEITGGSGNRLGWGFCLRRPGFCVRARDGEAIFPSGFLVAEIGPLDRRQGPGEAARLQGCGPATILSSSLVRAV